jgi:hypothetical protein
VAPPAISSEENATIIDFVDDFAREFRDGAKLKSSATRAARIYEKSGLSLDGFIECLYRARSATKLHQGQIRGSKMAYFFKLLDEETRAAKSAGRGPSPVAG